MNEFYVEKAQISPNCKKEFRGTEVTSHCCQFLMERFLRGRFAISEPLSHQCFVAALGEIVRWRQEIPPLFEECARREKEFAFAVFLVLACYAGLVAE